MASLPPRPRRQLTDVGMLQKTADPSLSLQFLVICGQRATQCDPPCAPAASNPSMPSTSKTSGCQTHSQPGEVPTASFHTYRPTAQRPWLAAPGQEEAAKCSPREAHGGRGGEPQAVQEEKMLHMSWQS